MSNYRNIGDMFKNWGKNSQKIPSNNLVLKSEILSKISMPPNKTISLSRGKYSLPWLPLTLATLSIMTFLGGSLDTRTISSLPSMPTQGSMSSQVVDGGALIPTVTTKNAAYEEASMPIYKGSGYEVAITDTREFMKTSYNATIQTRNIPDTVTKIELTVRGFDGRVDQSSNADQYGYIRFAIPSQKFEAFRQEIKTLTGKKLLIEQISKENFLPEKQSIEEQKLYLTKTLSDLKSERAQIIKNHTETVNSYSLKIRTLDQEATLLQTEWQTASNDRRIQINSRLSQIQTEKNTLEKQLGNEGINYQNNLVNITYREKNAEAGLQNTANQDKTLVENVSTVSGYISLSKINLWEMVDIYTPGPLHAWILLALAGLSYWRYSVSRRIFI